MSFTGRVEAKCPGCSEENDFEIWSFVRGDKDEALRDRLKGGELNVLECPNCGRLFYPDMSWVYADPTQELLAFVFPESYAAEEQRWRDKMAEDYKQIKPVAAKIGVHEEPLIFFGTYPLSDLVQFLELLDDEAEVAKFLAKDLGLTIRKVRASFARERRAPREIPIAQGHGAKLREGAIAGLQQLLKANDRLGGYKRWLEYLEGPGADPPWLAPRASH